MKDSNLVGFAVVMWIFGIYNLLLNLQISVQNSETLNKTELYILRHCGAFGCVLHGHAHGEHQL